MDTIETFRPTYQAFLESNLTARDFCKQVGIPESRFFYWQRKIRIASASPIGEFMPVSINNHSGKVVLVGGVHGKTVPCQSRPTCEILFPNGVTVRLSGEVPASAISQLVMLGR